MLSVYEHITAKSIHRFDMNGIKSIISFLDDIDLTNRTKYSKVFSIASELLPDDVANVS